MEYRIGRCLYENPLEGEKDVEGFVPEGEAALSFPRGRLRMESLLDPSLEGQAANFVLWCPEDFPADISITWDFHPLYEPGLCILFFAATGVNGEDVLDPGLAPRNGPYGQYHSGDINALHVSYFRRRYPQKDRAFHVSNLRKSRGFHLVAQGPDPLPGVADAVPPYRCEVIKCGPAVRFSINGLQIFQWSDDGTTHGPVLQGGKIGFRQMAPTIAEYADLQVHEVEEG